MVMFNYNIYYSFLLSLLFYLSLVRYILPSKKFNGWIQKLPLNNFEHTLHYMYNKCIKEIIAQNNAGREQCMRIVAYVKCIFVQ